MAKANPKAITVVATFLSPGVSKGAAGFMIVNGKIVKIPPRGPAFAQLTASIEAVAAGMKIR